MPDDERWVHSTRDEILSVDRAFDQTKEWDGGRMMTRPLPAAP